MAHSNGMDGLEGIGRGPRSSAYTPEGPRWATLVSGMLHPFTIPPLVFLLLFLAATDPATAHAGQVALGLSVAILFASALPLGAVVYMARRGLIGSIDISDRTKRTVPLLLTVASYAVGFIVLLMLQAPELVLGLMLAYAVNTALVAVITLWWKISIHAVAVGGPLAALTVALGLWLLPAYLLLGLIGSARVALGRHTVAQVVLGGVLGLGATALQLTLLAPML